MVVPSATKPRSYDGDYMAEGRFAEAVCMELLRRRPDVLDVRDTTGLRVLREADVDCCVCLKDGRIRLAEIKSDRHLGRTGNVLFEVLRINHTAAPDRCCVLGWSARSPAKWLLYYAPKTAHIYLCSFEALRAAFQHYTAEARGATEQRWVSTDGIKSTLNVLIPWDYCKVAFKDHIYDVADIAADQVHLQCKLEGP